AQVSLVVGTASAPSTNVSGITLTGDTSQPDMSTFVIGDPVELTFNVDNLRNPNGPVSLNLSIVDENGAKIEDKQIPVHPDSNGHWQTKLAGPASKLGFYRVYARLSDGVQLTALGTRAQGFITYAIVDDPAKRKNWGQLGSRFGMQGGWGPWGDKVIAMLGVRWVLDGGLNWKTNEPDHAGQFGPDQVKSWVNERKQGEGAGWQTFTVPSLFNCPAWACDPSTLDYETGTLTPQGEKDWAAYCKVAAKAYSERYPDIPEHVYQITWEPIQPWGFKGTNKDIVRIYQIAYAALHSVDPKAVVSGPTRGFTNQGDPQATENLFQLGLGKYLDGYTVHDYDAITPEQAGMPKSIRTMKAIIRKYVGHDLPMFGTEQGWATKEDPSQDITQAQGLIRQSLISLGEGLKFNFAFYIVDYHEAGQSGYGYYYNLDPGGSDWGPAKAGPKPIVPAYAAETWLLDGSTSDGAVDWLGSGTWGYVFERDSGRILVLWRYTGSSSAVVVPTGAKEVRVYDWMGNSHVVATNGGSIKLTLGPEPIYITGVSPALWGGTASKSLSLASSDLHSYPDSFVKVAGSTLLPGKKGTATLSLETQAPWITTPQTRRVSLGSKKTPFQFDLPISAGLKPGTYTARVILRSSAGAILSATGITVEVAAPLSAKIEATEAGGKPGVAVTLTDLRGQGMSGKVAFHLKELLPAALRSNLPMIDLVQAPGQTRDVPQAAHTLDFVVAPHGSKRMVISLGGVSLSPTRHYQVLLNVTASDGAKFALTGPVDFLTAKHVSKAPAVDADLSDWAAVPSANLQGKDDVVRSPEYYAPNVSASFRFAWDQKALYIASDVKDDVFFQTGTDANLWRQDCLQLAFNLDPAITDSSPNSDDRRTSELTVALTKNGPETFRALASGPVKLALGPVSQDRVPVAIHQTGGGNLAYEIAIPWTELGMAPGQSPRAGSTIGFAATVNEVRSADQSDPSALGIFAGIAADKDVDKHGTLLLAN
ncbi:MAG TPA: sugar-binding protein, partial [Capsulimonadaceae bacterium]|nr:sugar-binding protein [Capsulimonadaceae bacterium]